MILYKYSMWLWSIYKIIVPQYMNITIKFPTLKLLFFSFSSCLTIERFIVFKTMDRQCELFSRIFSSATGLDKSFICIRLLTETLKFSKNFKNFKILKLKINKFKVQNFKNFKKIQNFHKTCSHHLKLCWSLLSQKNQTLMNDGN
jgi:hypothetical protein